jgi:hypothetical protein
MLYYAIQPLGTDLIAIARQALAAVREKAVAVGDLKSGQGTVSTELRERGRLPGLLMQGIATIAPSFPILPTWRTRTSDSTQRVLKRTRVRHREDLDSTASSV